MFRVGQKVVCITDGPDHMGRNFVVREGRIYTVTRSFIWEDLYGEKSDCVLLAEVNPDRSPGWTADCFRAIEENKTDISIFTKMLTPNKVTEDA
jgi:hypothetical protein